MKRVNKLLALILTGTMALTTAACSSGTSSSAPAASGASAANSAAETSNATGNKKIVVGMTLYSLKNEFTVRLSNAAKKEAEKLGVELKIYDGNYDPNTQINQVETMISDGVDAIILNPQDAKACAVCVDKAVAKNIPVIGVNTRVDSDKLTSYVGSKDEYAGQLEMQAIADKIGGKGNIVVLDGPLGQSAQLERSKGIKDILEKYPDIKILAEKTANWSRSEAMTVMENWLQSFDKIDAIVGENDEMALGAMQAVKSKDKTIPCIGVDGITDGLKAVQSGTLIATIFQDGAGQGTKALDVAVQKVKGETVEKEYWIDFEKVTQDNVADYFKRTQ
ncbi:substrate-binding domain-containing protein [Caproicibacter sp. BJN0012]|uniref:substrate-binding domain-containing protein n=1 Tax=Caproicibacter sp. BJN0012 TaxID=3110227 RepID=UPI002E1442B4